MTLLQKKLLRCGVQVEVLTRRLWVGIERLFLSKAAASRRASGRFDVLQRRQNEAERLDRLRNPRKYQRK